MAGTATAVAPIAQSDTLENFAKFLASVRFLAFRFVLDTELAQVSTENALASRIIHRRIARAPATATTSPRTAPVLVTDFATGAQAAQENAQNAPQDTSRPPRTARISANAKNWSRILRDTEGNATPMERASAICDSPTHQLASNA